MKLPKKIEVTSVVKVTYEADDNPFLPNRIIQEFWTLDGRKIGRLDLLDQFPFIKDADSNTKYSDER
ncbi:hypothetical protein ING2D1G_0682 [Peptoniphilus sp. ING2-D1G]|nr:hypothetical protein ING2D1G_0682 [Peptoniphilus sp. ING2-D1G]